mgnify:CR=1 FL=1|tara:strand:+ start:2053 stop:4104 length:2052 start_codon:yes stop_codon:yes gene_type:complete
MEKIRTLEEIARDSLELNDIEIKPKETESNDNIDEETGLSWAEIGRLVSQGASLGFSDEIIGVIKGAVSSGVDIKDAIEQEREKLKTAQAKPGSLKYEIGGAVIPGLVAAPLTAGGSMAPSLLRAGAIGVGEGLVYGMGTGEGGVTERFVGGLDEAALGAVLNPATQKLISALSPAVKYLFSDITRKMSGQVGKEVEDELVRVLTESGVDVTNPTAVDDLLKQIADGKIVADLNEQSRNAVRAIYATSGEGGQIIADVLNRRAKTLTGDVTDTIASDLAPIGGGNNVTMAVNVKTKQLEGMASDAYQDVFDSAAPIGLRSAPELVDSLTNVINRLPETRTYIEKIMRAQGLPSLFNVNKKTKAVTFSRELTLEDAEIIRRAVKDATSDAYNNAKGTLGGVLRDTELSLRSLLDDYSPELAAVRAKWSAIQSAKDAFEEGKKIFSKSADDAEVFFEELVSTGNAETLEAFRQGVVASVRNKTSTSSGAPTTFVNRLNDLNVKERRIIETLYPGEKIEELLRKVDLASGANISKGKVLLGSPTAITDAGTKRVGTGAIAANMAEFVANPGMFSAFRLARNLMGEKSKNLSQEQLTDVAKLIMGEDPAVIRDALGNKEALEALTRRLIKAGQLITGGGGSAAVVAGDKANPFSTDFMSVNAGALQNITKDIKPSAKRKILDAANIQ